LSKWGNKHWLHSVVQWNISCKDLRKQFLTSSRTQKNVGITLSMPTIYQYVQSFFW
jgi:hypothetical protein